MEAADAQQIHVDSFEKINLYKLGGLLFLANKTPTFAESDGYLQDLLPQLS